MGALTAAGAALAGCGPAPTPEVIKEVVKGEVEVTRIIEKEGETIVEAVVEEVEVEGVVTATPAPMQEITMDFWFGWSGVWGDACKELALTFEELNPGVTINAIEHGCHADGAERIEGAQYQCIFTSALM